MNKTARLGFVIVILLLAGGYYFYKHTERTSGSYTYFGYYENVQGLAEGSPVHLKGVNIGKVTDITLYDEQIRVAITVPKQNQLTEGCTAVLVSGSSLLDNKSIEIHPGIPHQYMPDGARVQTSVDPTMVDNFSVVVAPAIEHAKLLLQATDTGLNDFMHMMTTGLTSRFVHMLIQLDTQTKQFSRTAATINQQSVAFTQTIRTTSQMISSLKQLNGDSTLRSAERQSETLAHSAIHENTTELKTAISGIRQNIEQIKQSPWVKDRENSAALSRSLDTLNRNIRALQEDPPGISIFGGKN